MTAANYYRHIRSLGAFRAVEALALAREAATLDEMSRVSVPPADVAREVLHDGSNPIHLSFGIKVF